MIMENCVKEQNAFQPDGIALLNAGILCAPIKVCVLQLVKVKFLVQF